MFQLQMHTKNTEHVNSLSQSFLQSNTMSLVGRVNVLLSLPSRTSTLRTRFLELGQALTILPTGHSFRYVDFSVIRLGAFPWRFPGLCWILTAKASNCCNYLTICSSGSLNLWSHTKTSDQWSILNVNSRRSKQCLKRRTNVLIFLCE